MLTLGADVELIVRNKQGVPVSAIPYINGDKHYPESVPKGAIQHDGVLAEFNIDPANNKKEFIDNTVAVMEYLGEHLARHDLSWDVVPSAHYGKDQLIDPIANQSGCDPDMNAWSRKINPAPKLGDTTLRTCGGHIHFGIPDHLNSFEHIRRMVLACDVLLGLPSLVLDKGGAERKKLFGRASCFRIKPYGFEYRTLSNFWVKNPNLIGWVHSQAEKVLASMDSQDHYSGHIETMRKLIDSGDHVNAVQYITHFKVDMP